MTLLPMSRAPLEVLEVFEMILVTVVDVIIAQSVAAGVRFMVV